MAIDKIWDSTPHTKKVKLFFFLTIFSFKQTSSKKLWKICGIPVFKIRCKKGGAKLKYFLFGFLPLLTIKTKRG